MNYLVRCPECGWEFPMRDGTIAALNGCVILCPSEKCGHMFTVRVAPIEAAPAYNAWPLLP